jgi:hypothetical protein
MESKNITDDRKLLAMLWTKLPLITGGTVWFNQHNGSLRPFNPFDEREEVRRGSENEILLQGAPCGTKSKRRCYSPSTTRPIDPAKTNQNHFEPILSMKGGGILCDEMGMGKSLTLLAFILATRDSSLGASLHVERRFEGANAESMRCLCGLAHPSDRALGPIIHSLSGPCRESNEEVGPESTKKKAKCVPTANPKKDFVETEIFCVRCGDRHHAVCAGFVREAHAGSLVTWQCPICEVEVVASGSGPFESSATILVVPNHLLSQWPTEFVKHMDAEEVEFSDCNSSARSLLETGVKRKFTVAIHPGVNAIREKSTVAAYRLYSISFVARHDLVITSSSALAEEFHWYNSFRVSQEGNERMLRRGKKRQLTSVFPHILWRRAIADEVQDFNSPGAHPSAMLNILHRRASFGLSVRILFVRSFVVQ